MSEYLIENDLLHARYLSVSGQRWTSRGRCLSTAPTLARAGCGQEQPTNTDMDKFGLGTSKSCYSHTEYHFTFIMDIRQNTL